MELVVELVDGCDHAGVTMASRDRVWGAATTDQVVADGDALQYELGEGPCLDAVRFKHTEISHELAGDRRWPRWGLRMVSEYGVHGMVSLLLGTDQDTIGASNLYGDEPTWTSDAIAVATCWPTSSRLRSRTAVRSTTGARRWRGGRSSGRPKGF